jgi:Lrp/AsnC family transcriptional regulator, leucine-responsive regulatory protein
MDSIDLRILHELERNGRQTNAELSQTIKLSQSACLRRVKALEDNGVIVGYTAVVDPDKIDRGTLIVITATIQKADRSTIDRLKHAVQERGEVVFCALMMSNPDLVMHVRVKDVTEFEALYLDHLAELPGVTRLNSQLAIDIIVQQAPVPAL